MKYERLRNLREDLDLTQADMAKKLNITQRAYSRYETGERAVPIEVFIQLADFYKTTIDYLVGRTNKKY